MFHPRQSVASITSLLTDHIRSTMTIKAIIFDVDRTLADTEDGHRQSFN